MKHDNTNFTTTNLNKFKKVKKISGLGTAFFCVQNVPFFCVLKRERYVLFRSFQKNGKERKERNVLLKRTEKNAKNGTFF